MTENLPQRTLQLLQISLFCGLVAVATPAAATLLTFDFEDVAAGEYGGCAAFPQLGYCDFGSGALVSRGFVFDPGAVDWSPDAQSWIGHHHIVDPTQAGWTANNGTQYFAFDYFLDQSRLNIYGASGQVFGIHQFDLAETFANTCNTNLPPVLVDFNCGVTFLGRLANGGTVSRHIVLDGVADGDGPLSDFETFVFDQQWNSLTAFSIVSNHQYLNPGLDNVVLQTIPEPSMPALLGVGLAGLAFARRRSHPDLR